MDLTVDSLSLNASDKQEQEANGAFKWEKRVRWSVHYLKAYGGLISSPGYRLYEVTAAGREYLGEHPGLIPTKDLTTLRAAGSAKQQTDANVLAAGLSGVVTTLDTDASPYAQSSLLAETVGSELFGDADATPDDLIQTGYQQLQERLVYEMLESVKGVTPTRFEMLVVDLLMNMGYGEGQAVGKSGDGGIDGVINQDALGLEKVYIQAKRYTVGMVSDPDMQKFAGSMIANGATKGVFITTADFTGPARQTARNVSRRNETIRLVDGSELAQLMIKHGVGVVTEYTYEIKKLDENYFAEEI